MENSEAEKDNQTNEVDSKVTKSTLVSRNITILGRRTSVRLEPEMWVSLKEIAKRERCTIHDICSLISLRKNENTSLTAAIRVFLMLYFRASSTEEGHISAGHGSFETMKQRAKIAPHIQLKHFPKNEDDDEEHEHSRYSHRRFYGTTSQYSEKYIN